MLIIKKEIMVGDKGKEDVQMISIASDAAMYGFGTAPPIA